MLKILWLLLVYLVPLESLKYIIYSRQSSPCKGNEFGEFVANPEDCKLFYLCGDNGEANLATCPLNMLFNPQTKLCDNPTNVHCETVTNNKKPTEGFLATSSSAPALITSDNRPPLVDNYCYNYYAQQASSYALIFVPHPRQCQQYYMCYKGQALLQACSPQLHWNTKLNKCDLASQANCVPSNFESGKEEDVEILPSLDEPIWGNGIKCPMYGEHIFPNIKRCDTFIYCVKGQAVLQVCPFYQYFDVDSGRCQWRSKSTCVKDLNNKYRKRNVF